MQTRDVQTSIHDHAQATVMLLSDSHDHSLTKCACRQCSRSHAIMTVHCDAAAGAGARDFGLTRSGKVGPHIHVCRTITRNTSISVENCCIDLGDSTCTCLAGLACACTEACLQCREADMPPERLRGWQSLS